MMHGEQDMLIIGEIIAIEDGLFTIAVSDTIVCKGSPRQQIKAETVKIHQDDMRLEDVVYSTYREKSPQVGEYVFASLDRKQDGHFQAHWAFFRVDSLDKATLSIIIPEDELDYNGLVYWRREGAALECFIHSDGEIAEFFFLGDETVGYYADGEAIHLYWEPPVPLPAVTEGGSLANGQDSVETEELAEPAYNVEPNEPNEAAVATETPAGELHISDEINMVEDNKSSKANRNYLGIAVLAAVLCIIGFAWFRKKRK
jgi:hypothetical protein